MGKIMVFSCHSLTLLDILFARIWIICILYIYIYNIYIYIYTCLFIYQFIYLSFSLFIHTYTYTYTYTYIYIHMCIYIYIYMFCGIARRAVSLILAKLGRRWPRGHGRAGAQRGRGGHMGLRPETQRVPGGDVAALSSALRHGVTSHGGTSPVVDI